MEICELATGTGVRVIHERSHTLSLAAAVMKFNNSFLVSCFQTTNLTVTPQQFEPHDSVVYTLFSTYNSQLHSKLDYLDPLSMPSMACLDAG